MAQVDLGGEFQVPDCFGQDLQPTLDQTEAIERTDLPDFVSAKAILSESGYDLQDLTKLDKLKSFQIHCTYSSSAHLLRQKLPGEGIRSRK
jgi:hypothetical protein